MKNTILILLFILVQQIVFGRTKGTFSAGLSMNSNIESGLRFQTLPQLNIGRFYTKNLEIGLKMGGNYKKSKFNTDILIDNKTYNEFI
jgi:hypothetical protein